MSALMALVGAAGVILLVLLAVFVYMYQNQVDPDSSDFQIEALKKRTAEYGKDATGNLYFP